MTNCFDLHGCSALAMRGAGRTPRTRTLRNQAGPGVNPRGRPGLRRGCRPTRVGAQVRIQPTRGGAQVRIQPPEFSSITNWSFLDLGSINPRSATGADSAARGANTPEEAGDTVRDAQIEALKTLVENQMP